MKKKSVSEGSATLPEPLRKVVKDSVALFGVVLKREIGAKHYEQIERVRARMAAIRTGSHAVAASELMRTYSELEKLDAEERRDFARAYTLMFEVMNACEGAYRTFRLRAKPAEKVKPFAEGIFYVVTAHPTEARSPDNIAIFHEIQKILLVALEQGFESVSTQLETLLAVAWKVRIVRYRSPKVSDEAEHIYSIVLREENLSALLKFGREVVPVYLRSWVGGDKDGHPGVNEKTLGESLQLSRKFLLRYVDLQLDRARALTELFASKEIEESEKPLRKTLMSVRKISTGDGARVERLKSSLDATFAIHSKVLGHLPDALVNLQSLLKAFPGLVVPLELREDSALIMSDPTGKTLAIGRMLHALERFSRGGDPTWYARGMIISMTESALHIRTTAKLVKRIVGDLRIPVVPLFEQAEALKNSPAIISEIADDPLLKKAIRGPWQGKLQIMLGYSDSSKESGVLKSRLAVTDAMNSLDAICRKKKIQPLFFHGSGGSIDRGGGAINDQISAWPESALRNYKATIQGEMIERSFSSPEILESRFRKIAEGGHSAGRKKLPTVVRSPVLEDFAEQVAAHYRATIASPRFLSMVEKATPYRYLNVLKIGSRPSKRPGALSVPALRAIPWVLCWTQTRVLFQTWWGMGSVWKSMSKAQQKTLKGEFIRDPLFRTYVNALGFTLAKIELPVWELYLETSGIDRTEIDYFKALFRAELRDTWNCFRAITGETNPTWFRPWLGKSIELRASLIHPLNILEILAQKDEDLPLVRISVTGIASGMLTTG